MKKYYVTMNKNTLTDEAKSEAICEFTGDSEDWGYEADNIFFGFDTASERTEFLLKAFSFELQTINY